MVSLVVIFAFIVTFVGCATIPMESNMDKPVSMTEVKDETAKTFVSNNKALWLFWGIIPLSVPEIDNVLVPQVSGHDGVQNLKITTESGFIDLVVTILTQGILFMRTVRVQGEVYD
jgi:hypothetical protein